MKKWSFALAAAALAMLISMSGCARDTRLDDADIHMNPAPRMRYLVTARISDAPGAFDSFEGSVGYEVRDRTCVPLTAFEGAALFPRKYVPIAFARQHDGSYNATIVVDLLKDEDYFGLGICHWTMSAVDFTAIEGPTNFSVALSGGDLTAKKEVTRYFARTSYRELNLKYPSGNADRADFKNPVDTFSLSITAAPVAPETRP